MTDLAICAKCHCKDVRIIHKFVRAGVDWVKVTCRHCGKIWSYPDFKDGETKVIIDYPKLVCPFCEGDKITVVGTRDTFRYHKCKDCKRSFSSVEKIYTQSE